MPAVLQSASGIESARGGARCRDPLAGPQGADDAVLVEAPAPVGAAVVGAARRR